MATASRLRISTGAALKSRIFRPFEPVERQQALGREFGVHARHAHLGDLRQHGSIEPGMLRLALVIEFLADARADLLRDLARVDRRWSAGDARRRAGRAGVRSASTADCMSGYCSFTASGAPSVVVGAMHLAERGGGGGLQVEEPKRLRQSGPSSLIIRRVTKAAPMGGASLCSFCSSRGVFGRHEVRHGREQLRDLHDRALQPAERGRQRGRVDAPVPLAPAAAAASRSAPRPRRRPPRPAHSAPHGRKNDWLRGLRAWGP